MKTIITCGHPCSGLQLAHDVQIQAGLAQAQPSRREGISANELHDKIFRAHGPSAGGLGVTTAISPGRIWHELTADLLVSNVDQGDWGWADSRSVWLLGFLKEIDPQTRFLLVYSAPEYALASALRDKLAIPEKLEDLLVSWLAYHSEMLRFYNRNPGRCLLVNIAAVALETTTFVGQLNTAFDLALDASSIPDPSDRVAVPAVAAALARVLLAGRLEVRSLYRELESSADLAQPAESTAVLDNGRVVAEYLALVARVEQAAVETSENTRRAASQDAELARLSTELKARAGQLAQVQADFEQLQRQQATLATERTQLEQQLEETRNAAEQARTVSTQENELLLRQLHQAQEELEAHFLRLQETSARLTAEQTRLVQAEKAHAKATMDAHQQTQLLTQEREQHARITADRQTQIQKLTQAHDQQARLATDRLAQIQKLTQARDEQAKLAAERQAQLEKLAPTVEEHHRLKKQHAELQRQHTDLQSRLQKVEAREASGRAELTQENEVLLLQIHQLQEELEHSYLQWQSLSAPTAAAADASGISLTDIGQIPQASEEVIDFRGWVDGDNWYDAEHDGRWAGPGKLSTVVVPALRCRRCEFSLDVVDAMEPAILAGLEISLNGTPLKTTLEGKGYPSMVISEFAVGAAAGLPHWEFQFKLPKLVSPAQHGSADRRHLGIRVRSLKLRVTE